MYSPNLIVYRLFHIILIMMVLSILELCVDAVQRCLNYSILPCCCPSLITNHDASDRTFSQFNHWTRWQWWCNYATHISTYTISTHLMYLHMKMQSFMDLISSKYVFIGESFNYLPIYHFYCNNILQKCWQKSYHILIRA